MATTQRSWRVALPGVVAFVVALALFPWGQMQRYLLSPAIRWHAGHEHKVLAVREGRTETAVIVERRHAGERLSTYLVTDAIAMSSTATFARRYMKLFVYWPVALRPDPRSALLISYGVGSTARALVDTRSLQTIDIVDTSREILELSDVVFPDYGDNPLNDPRVRVHVEDGRFFLNLTPQRYDLVTAEPPPPKNAGIVNLYTREYFSLIRDRLNEGGVASYWLPVHSLLESDAKAILRAFCEVFDDCALWVGQGFDWMMTGSRGLSRAPSEAEFSAQWRDPVVAPELRALGFERPELLGATFLGDAEWLRSVTTETAPLTDRWPKRLADRPQRDARLAFLDWLDEEAAAERFRESAYLRESWPAGLRQRTQDYFEVQRTINEVALKQWIDWPGRLRSAHQLLAARQLPEIALWRLGLTSDWVDAARGAVRKRRPLAPHTRTIAIRSLVDGDFPGAARYLAAARRMAGEAPGQLLLEAYALFRAGDAPAARTLLARHSQSLAHLGDGIAWLEQTFAVDGAGP